MPSDRYSYKIWAPIVVILAISLSMHHRSYDAVSGAAQMLLQQDLFTPTRLDAASALGAGDNTQYTATDADAQQADEKEDEGDKPKDIGKPLNVVIMYGDDWRHDAIGVGGSKWPVHTPFIDWLATNKGLRFTHNCVTSSICWISRATLHTGTCIVILIIVYWYCFV